jgi:hypothetical protein
VQGREYVSGRLFRFGLSSCRLRKINLRNRINLVDHCVLS